MDTTNYNKIVCILLLSNDNNSVKKEQIKNKKKKIKWKKKKIEIEIYTKNINKKEINIYKHKT